MRPLWHFLCAGSSKPIRGQWKAFHCRSWPLPHSLTAELEAWWIVVQDNVMLLDWMLCFDLTGCPWSFNNGWYVNNRSGYSSSILHLLPCQSEPRGEGETAGRGDKSLLSLPPCGTPVESRLAWRHALSRTHKVPASDTLTPEPGTRSPASAAQTLYSAEWRKHNYIGPKAYN